MNSNYDLYIILVCLGSMAWVLEATLNLPKFNVSDRQMCKDQVEAFLKEKKLSMLVKSGRPGDGDCTMFFCYCTTHEDCKFRYKHVFVSSGKGCGNVNHTVLSKHFHSDRPRIVRGATVLQRKAAQNMTEHVTPMRVIADLLQKGEAHDKIPGYKNLQTARRRNLRGTRSEVCVGGDCSLGSWLEHLKKAAKGKWNVIFHDSGLCVLIHPKFGEDI